MYTIDLRLILKAYKNFKRFVAPPNRRRLPIYCRFRSVRATLGAES